MDLIKKSFADITIAFEKLYVENQELKKEILKLRKKPEIIYSKFYDFTFLYAPGFYCSINSHFKEEYHNSIRLHLCDNKHKYNDGDILFIGSTYETRQEYGFAHVINGCTDFHNHEWIIMETPGVYYSKVIEEINTFWKEFCDGDDLLTELSIEELKICEQYEP